MSGPNRLQVGRMKYPGQFFLNTAEKLVIKDELTIWRNRANILQRAQIFLPNFKHFSWERWAEISRLLSVNKIGSFPLGKWKENPLKVVDFRQSEGKCWVAGTHFHLQQGTIIGLKKTAAAYLCKNLETAVVYHFKGCKSQRNKDKRRTCGALGLSRDWCEFTGAEPSKSIITVSFCRDLMFSPCWDCGSRAWI